jgi:large subunit ribosomal protein L10
MRKDEKIKFVEEWQEEIRSVPYAVLVDYRGLTVAEATALRTRIRDSRSIYRVVKNNLARRAVAGSGLEKLGEHFEGPCAVAYNDHDPILLAKTLIDFSKDNPSLKIKIGVVDGQLLQPQEIEQLSKTPGREELLSKLLYLMKYPIQGLASALNNIVRNLAAVLNQVAEQKK